MEGVEGGGLIATVLYFKKWYKEKGKKDVLIMILC